MIKATPPCLPILMAAVIRNTGMEIICWEVLVPTEIPGELSCPERTIQDWITAEPSERADDVHKSDIEIITQKAYSLHNLK